MSTKKALTISLLLILFLGLVYAFRSINSVEPILTIPDEQITYDKVELKTQKDFKLLGEQIFQGGGFEPGFNFKIYEAGKSYGTDLLSQYGDTHYVGYLSLASSTDAFKIFSGKMLDKDDKMVDGNIKLILKDCVEPSGETVPVTAELKVGKENLQGCAKQTK